jgi:hypothetical protein
MNSSISRTVVALASLCAAQMAWSQAPGSDPIQLHGEVSYLAMPTASPARSKDIDRHTDIPSNIKAKISRFEAKSFAVLNGGDGTIQTGQDVISTSTGSALEKSCTQSVGSNTVTPTAGPSGRYGTGSAQDQIVVLRGDLVNICR